MEMEMETETCMYNTESKFRNQTSHLSSCSALRHSKTKAAAPFTPACRASRVGPTTDAFDSCEQGRDEERRQTTRRTPPAGDYFWIGLSKIEARMD